MVNYLLSINVIQCDSEVKGLGSPEIGLRVQEVSASGIPV